MDYILGLISGAVWILAIQEYCQNREIRKQIKEKLKKITKGEQNE